MAATFSVRPSQGSSNVVHTNTIPGNSFEDIIEITAGTGDYLAGGYAFGTAQLQTLYGGAYSTILSVDVVDHWRTKAGGGTSAFIAVYDSVNGKVQAYGMNAAAAAGNPLTEIPNATAGLNGLICSLRVRFF